MPYCPKCRNEYVDEAKTCDDCGVALVTEAPPNDPYDHSDLVEAWHTHGEMEAQMVRALLDSNGIDVVFSGESLRLTHGFTIDGLAAVRILVRPEDAKRAQEVIGMMEGMARCGACGYPNHEDDKTCHSCEAELA